MEPEGIGPSDHDYQGQDQHQLGPNHLIEDAHHGPPSSWTPIKLERRAFWFWPPTIENRALCAINTIAPAWVPQSQRPRDTTTPDAPEGPRDYGW